ncbi:MAG: hypothetical protein Q9226_001965 [Calogaya cf. arnoldii]
MSAGATPALFQLATVEEAKEAAEGAYAWAKAEHQKASDWAVIEAAGRNTGPRVPGVLDAASIGWIKKIYGKDYITVSHDLAKMLEDWILKEWLPGLLKYHSKMFVKSKIEDNRVYLQELTVWRFMENIWFKVGDYPRGHWFVPAIRYYRARLWKQSEEEEKNPFFETIMSVIHEHM